MTRVLVLGDYRQSLAIARSLAARGDTVISAITDARASYLRRSRAVSEHLVLRTRVGAPGFDDLIQQVIDSHSIDVLFPVGDLEIAWAAADLDRFGIPVASVDSEVSRICQDKPALLAMCDEVGVSHSRSHVVESLPALRDALVDSGLPAIVKSNDPLLRLFGRKGVVLRDASDIDQTFSEWPSDHSSLIVQSYVDGPRHNVYFVAERGNIRGLGQVEILRTDTADGTGYAVDGRTVVPNARLVHETESLAAELKYHGVGCTQFLVAPDGTTSFLELNPRLGANFSVVDRAGLALACHAVDIALERTVRAGDARADVRYAWTLGDIEGLAVALRRREVGAAGAMRWLGRVTRSAVAADVHVTWAWRDPMPTLGATWQSVVRPLLRRAFRRPNNR